MAAMKSLVSAARRAVVPSARFTTVRAINTSAVARQDDADHKAWLAKTKNYEVVEPSFEWTVDRILPVPIPTHQFEQPPIVIEVQNRNADFDPGHH